MKRIFQRTALVVAAILTLGGAAMSFVNAQANNNQANGFRISPVRSELTIEKGKSQTLTINIQNPTDVQLVAKPVVTDFVANDREDGEPQLILDDKTPLPKNDFKKLVGPIADVTLGPKEKKDISVQISVPKDANTGGYYGAVLFKPNTDSQAGNVGLTASVGTIVLVRVPGNLTEKLDLLQLGAAKRDDTKIRGFFVGGQLSSIVRLKNSGDIHLQPFGKVLIKNTFGKIVAQYELNPEPRSNVLPDSIRRFSNPIDIKHPFGRYTIEANLGYSESNGQLLSAKATFWYIPAWAIIAFVVLLLAIAGAVYWFMMRRDSRLHHKTKE